MKNLTPRQQWFYALFAVGLFAIILGWTVETETMLFWTLIALTAVSIWQMLVVPKERPMTPEETDLARIDTLKARLDRYRLSLSALPEGVILIRLGIEGILSADWSPCLCKIAAGAICCLRLFWRINDQ